MKNHKTTEPADVREQLTEMKKDEKPKTKLVFNTISGNLEVAPKESDVKGEDVVVDQIYKDGFFAKAA